MPEGDTVWRTARHLDRALSGHVLVGSQFRVPAHATADLSGQTVQETVARGKHLLTRIGDDVTLHTHLKMEGSWHLYREGTRWRRPAHEARVVLRTEAWTAVGFALGVVELLARDDEESAVGHLGPDLLGADWDAAEAARRILREPERSIGEALLDQRNLAGIGTIYRSESLFLTGVNPATPAGEVPSVTDVVTMARRLLLANRERAGTVTTGDTRRGRGTWVFERTGRPCRRCGTPISFDRIGPPGKERTSYWCPRCQPR